MAKVCIAEPVEETRELVTRLVQRCGHEVLAEGDDARADVVVYEAASSRCRRLAARLAGRTPLIALSAEPGATHPGIPVPQPFSPRDLRRALEHALASRMTAV